MREEEMRRGEKEGEELGKEEEKNGSNTVSCSSWERVFLLGEGVPPGEGVPGLK